MRSDFAVFILTHGRPDNIKTLKVLSDQGYTGDIIILIDSMDSTADRYHELFGEQVYVFDKAEEIQSTDSGDNKDDDHRTILYARNAVFKAARELGYRYFIQLDDDYIKFEYRYRSDMSYGYVGFPTHLDNVFELLVRFLEETPAVTISLTQGGDFIGGAGNQNAEGIRLLRKAMNTFVCSVERPIGFVGRFNEDVNTFVTHAMRGGLMVSTTQVSVIQTASQSQAGGITELYLKYGTYVKSFYSVMYAPSCVKIRMMGDKHRRLHHNVSWNNAAVKILHEKHRKVSA